MTDQCPGAKVVAAMGGKTATSIVHCPRCHDLDIADAMRPTKMTDQARAALLETVLTEEQRKQLANFLNLMAIHAHDPITCADGDECEGIQLEAIIDSLITYGVEWHRAAGLIVMAADGVDPTDRTPDRLPTLVADRIEAAEARLTAVRELRDTLRADADILSRRSASTEAVNLRMVADMLDRILDDASTGGTET